jgi:hypothetical protein
METRPAVDGGGREAEWSAAAPLGRAEGTRGERLSEIRRRIADDVYRSPVVAEVIARRMLVAREP